MCHCLKFFLTLSVWKSSSHHARPRTKTKLCRVSFDGTYIAAPIISPLIFVDNEIKQREREKKSSIHSTNVPIPPLIRWKTTNRDAADLFQFEFRSHPIPPPLSTSPNDMEWNQFFINFYVMSRGDVTRSISILSIGHSDCCKSTGRGMVDCYGVSDVSDSSRCLRK